MSLTFVAPSAPAVESAPGVLLFALELAGLLRAVAGSPSTAAEVRAARLVELADQFDGFVASGHRDADQAVVCAEVARMAAAKLHRLGGGSW